jgi:hypothetical protein
MGPSASSARLGKHAPEEQGVDQRAQSAHALVTEKKLVESVAEANGDDFQQAQEAHETILTAAVQ